MSGPLRIAIVLERFEPARGGTERYASGLVRRLVERGHDVTVVAARAEPTALHGATLRTVRVSSAMRAWRVWSFARRAAAVTRDGYDVVHGLQKSLAHTVFQPHTGSHRATLLAARRARPSAMARAWHWIGKVCSFKQWVFAAIERRQYAQTPPPVFVAIAPMVRQQMRELHGVDPAQIEDLPNPVDATRFAPATTEARRAARDRLEAPAEARVALFVGHEPRLKGLAAAVRAAAGAFDECWVIGRGLDRRPPWLPAESPEMRVRWLGARPDMTDYYAGADALLLPTAYDPAPLVVLEALAAGLQVLTTEACGLAELVRDAGGQVVPDRNDVTALAAAARAVAQAPRPDAQFRARLVATHGWNAHCDALEAIYRRAAGSPR